MRRAAIAATTSHFVLAKLQQFLPDWGMSSKKTSQKKQTTTNLAGHRRHKKTLIPPLIDLPMTPSSWVDSRMPELLWVVLLREQLGRIRAIEVFNYIANYVASHKECGDVMLTALGRLHPDARREFIRYVVSLDAKNAQHLRPLLLFSSLPGRVEWAQELGEAVGGEDWKATAAAVSKVLFHQSEQATDCRWMRLIGAIAGGRIAFSSEVGETLRRITEYPNYSDPGASRATIRAAEIGLSSIGTIDNSWPNEFWKQCYSNTGCIPERKKTYRDLDSNQRKRADQHYLEESRKIEEQIASHFFSVSHSTELDSKLESSFGLTLYALTVFQEIAVYRIEHSTIGRFALRTLAESLISLSYLIEKNDPRLWDEFRSYGTGQIKLTVLKMHEIDSFPNYLSGENWEAILNEDVWEEFVSINLGNWNDSGVRERSQDGHTKEEYDKYFAPASGYIHANWGAIRECAFDNCMNPLHRRHRIPTRQLLPLNEVLGDARILMNRILGLLGHAYPTFEERIAEFVASEHQLDTSDPKWSDALRGSWKSLWVWLKSSS